MRPISNHIFFEEIASQISDGKTVRIKARGTSMLPFIRDGKDEIILQKLTLPVKTGMLLLAKLENYNYVIHRVEKVMKHKIILRGDGNVTGREVCTANQIVANVAAVVRNGKTITADSNTWKLFRHLWTKHRIPRKLLLALHRRLF